MIGFAAMNLDADGLLYGGAAFLLLATFWYQTGRLFLVGWIVWVLWLPVRIICIPIWFTVLKMNDIFDFLRSKFIFKLLFNLIFTVILYFAYQANSIVFAVAWLVYFGSYLLIRFGLDEERFYRWIKYYPKAKRIPAAKTDKAFKKLMEADKKAELLPRPLVKFLLKPQTKIETEAEIMENLDEHLKQLIRVIK